MLYQNQNWINPFLLHIRQKIQEKVMMDLTSGGRVAPGSKILSRGQMRNRWIVLISRHHLFYILHSITMPDTIPVASERHAQKLKWSNAG